MLSIKNQWRGVFLEGANCANSWTSKLGTGALFAMHSCTGRGLLWKYLIQVLRQCLIPFQCSWIKCSIQFSLGPANYPKFVRYWDSERRSLYKDKLTSLCSFLSCCVWGIHMSGLVCVTVPEGIIPGQIDFVLVVCHKSCVHDWVKPLGHILWNLVRIPLGTSEELIIDFEPCGLIFKVSRSQTKIILVVHILWGSHISVLGNIDLISVRGSSEVSSKIWSRDSSYFHT